MRIAKHFATEEEAGKVPCDKALKRVRQSAKDYKPELNCFAAPEWLRKAIERDYGTPVLDVAAGEENHFGEKYYTLEQDALKQNWQKDSHGGLVWCNSPFHMSVLPDFVTMAHRESQRGDGCTVICLLPFWRNYPWFELVKKYAEVRLPGKLVIGEGFGAMEGKQVGWRNEYEYIIAIFRKDQVGHCGDWLDP